MRNSCFYFKQFAIAQDKCAMKVGTDGILLGAWARLPENAQILDIGTGTGLLALMLAQRSQSSSTFIDAVEIDHDAYQQAKENIESSPWRDRINIDHASIQDWAIACSQQYDLIISNPPFFENAFKPSQNSRNLARHSDSLSQTDILQIASQLLKPNGHLAVIYPTDLANNFLAKAQSFNLFCDRQVHVKPTPQSPVKRMLLELSPTKYPTQTMTITIEERKHLYTQDYIALVKDFYLNL
ncbi:tRNA1(Val) (adenine(37)-N6)-methyltransferase [Phormidium tenue]|uniref:tRNA1(Val) (adenine(37)-N6)-methyltransferase n=1 Tax=Phormidium tenue FACHB-1050 TaxID=2692857 RepID=A0ABR8C9D6_9CYAN|nr:methyltransferase [Phormidium tenue]MBD2316172.1 methyltransferase [Phormidium tenue FACHB-1050]